MLLTLPCIAAFFIIPETLMRALFARGAFNLTAADISAAALVAYGIGLPAFVLLRCVVPSFYARGDTATPVRATLLSVVANIGMKIALVWGLGFGVVGLALGTSFGAWVNFAVLAFLARATKALSPHPSSSAPFCRSARHRPLPRRFLAGVRLGRTLIGPGAASYDVTGFAVASLCGACAYVLTVVALRRRLPFRGVNL
jgi:putative peptidoglycan lipid II flippase